MQLDERRAEIIRILIWQRKITIKELSKILNVSVRTVKRDIAVLILEFPIKQVSGVGGGVALPDWYHPYKKIFSQIEIAALEKAIVLVDEPYKGSLQQMLKANGS